MTSRTLAALLATAMMVMGARAEDASTVDVPCGPLSDMKDAGKYRVLTHDEWTAARVAFFLNANTPTALPPGDSAMVKDNGDGSAELVFVDGDSACAPMRLVGEGVNMLKQIRDKVIMHPKGSM